MGEVYRARDTKLQRDVALKVLPTAFHLDPERHARFAREAQVLASLNHPNIAAIYGVEEGDDVTALVLELVDGPTLADRLAAGPIPPDEALPIARQLADALAAAHAQGIVHRDLKPANIKMRSNGAVKVLDFGLAKALDPPADTAAGMAATITSPAMTRAGVILGTAAYMSPEQARGLAVDARSDIWSFGCVLYEMLTGDRPFDGSDTTEALAAVLRAEPDWSRLRRDTPPGTRRLLRRCLEKDRDRRLADIRDARPDLERTAEESTEASRPHAVSWRERAVWVAALLALGVAALALWRSQPTTSPSPAQVTAEITIPSTTDPVSFAISPDGKNLVYVASPHGAPQLWLRSLETGETRALRETIGATLPFWSPDGRWVGFFTQERLYKTSIDGGRPRVVAIAPLGTGGAWTRNGEILFPTVPDSPVMRVPEDADGVEGSPATPRPGKPSPGGLRFPQAFPDGEHFLYYIRETRSVHLGRIGSPDARRLIDADAAAVFAPPDRILFVRERRLLSQRLDMSRLELVGEPRAIGEDVLVDSRGVAAVSASAVGSIVYRKGSVDQQRSLAWYDRSGTPLGMAAPADTTYPLNPSLSPDGRSVVLSRSIDGNTDVWILDLERASMTRFTADPGPEIVPVWGPGGESILFSKAFGPGRFELAFGRGRFELYRKPLTEGGRETPLGEGDGRAIALDWSRDGRFVLFRSHLPPGHGWNVWALSTADGSKPFPVLQSRFDERTTQFSPDGRWIAYESNETGRYEVYVHPFPGPGEKIAVSTTGGSRPRWSADGREIFYIASDGGLMAVAVRTTAGRLALDAPVKLFAPKIEHTVEGGIAHAFAVTSDARRFLFSELVTHPAAPVTLVLHAQE
jgi:serine/threonine protein kinase